QEAPRDPHGEPEADEDTEAGKIRRATTVYFGNPFDRDKGKGKNIGRSTTGMMMDEASDEAAILTANAGIEDEEEVGAAQAKVENQDGSHPLPASIPSATPIPAIQNGIPSNGGSDHTKGEKKGTGSDQGSPAPQGVRPGDPEPGTGTGGG
ncbi:unnamed protein product, partial [Discosporangium mesarthrocarpum]